MYKAGTVTLVHGSSTVTGTSTEFLKFVSSGDMLKVTGVTSLYIVASITSNTVLLLTTPFQGTSIATVTYTITTDRTPNASLPLVSPNQPDSTAIVNTALLKIDKHMGEMLDYHSLSAVSYSGENTFYIKANYRADELKVGRAVKFLGATGEVQTYDVVTDNTIFEADISTTPLGQIVAYTNETSGEVRLGAWDVIQNTKKDSYVFVESIDTTANEITITGEVIGSAWSSEEPIKCFGKTQGFSTIDSALTSTALTLDSVTGELTDFDPEYRLYNYQKNSYRTIQSRDTLTLNTAESDDDWALGDDVYTILADIQVEMNNIPSNVASVEYGAQAQIGTDSVGDSHMDWGHGSDQVDATSIPINLSGLSGENINAAMTELNAKMDNHLVTGEAHTGNEVAFSDDAQGYVTLSSSFMQDALNELKTYIGTSGRIQGEVTSADDETTFYATSFISYDPTFFNDYIWYCRFDNGINIGDLRLLTSFESGEAQFYFSGEAQFTEEPDVGDVFTMFLTTPTP